MAVDLITIARWLFGVSLFLSWANSATHVIASSALIYTRGVKGLGKARPKRRKVLLVAALTMLFLAATAAFVLRWQELPAAATILAVMFVIRRLEIREWNEPLSIGLGKYAPSAAALLGYVAAWSVAAGLGWPAARREEVGWEAACGVLAATYVLAALAKVRHSGSSWMTARTVTLLVAERAYVKQRWLRALRMGVAERPRAAWFVAFYGMAIEWLAVAYVLPWARWPFTVATTLMQIGIALFLGYYEWEWVVVMIALTLAST